MRPSTLFPSIAVVPFLTARLSGLFLALLCSFAPASAAPLHYTIQAAEAIDTTIVPPDAEEGDPGETTLRTTTFSRPAFLDYTGVTDTVTMDFLAPAGFKFVVTPQGDSRLGFQVAYTNFSTGGASGGISRLAGSVSFLNPEGTVPSLSDFSSLANHPHAYQAVTISASSLPGAFAFTGLRYTFNVSGTGAAVSVPYFEGGNLSVSMNGLAAAGPALLAVTAIPEPAGATASASFAVAAWLALRRRRGMRA